MGKFGSEIFTGSGIDRVKLGKIAFASKKNLSCLCAIVHPKTIEAIKNRIEKSKCPVTVIDAPLLIEAGLDRAMDYVVAVKCPRGKRIARGAAKGLGKASFTAREKAQIPLSKKIKRADFVIDNNRTKRDAQKKVRIIWQKLKRR